MSKEYTTEEVRKKFLEQVWNNIKYWDELACEKTTKERLQGLAFSILATLDGCDIDLPGFIVAPLPHENDKEYLIENEEDYFPENHENDVNADISGYLHDMFHRVGKEMGIIE